MKGFRVYDWILFGLIAVIMLAPPLIRLGWNWYQYARAPRQKNYWP